MDNDKYRKAEQKLRDLQALLATKGIKLIIEGEAGEFHSEECEYAFLAVAKENDRLYGSLQIGTALCVRVTVLASLAELHWASGELIPDDFVLIDPSSGIN